jgi:hypothetical protein
MRRLLVRVSWLLAICLIAIGLGNALFAHSPKSSEITSAACEKIAPGMTQAQVEEILGGPPRREVWVVGLEYRDSWRSDFCRKEEWWGEDGVVFVAFDNTDKVVRANFVEHWCEVRRPSIWDRIRTGSW